MMLVLLASPAADATASSGEITRAEANADWTFGGIAGSAAWSGCPVVLNSEFPIEPVGHLSLMRENCRIQAYLTVGAGSDPSECSDQERRWPHSNERVTLAWSSEESARGGSSAFDLAEVPLSGAPGQLTCLSVLETWEERPFCPSQPGIACPQFIVLGINYGVLASALLSAPSASEPDSPLSEPESQVIEDTFESPEGPPGGTSDEGLLSTANPPSSSVIMPPAPKVRGPENARPCGRKPKRHRGSSYRVAEGLDQQARGLRKGCRWVGGSHVAGRSS
jgi:hypothetical protein